MIKKIEFTVIEINSLNHRLDNFLFKNLCSFSKSYCKECIINNQVLINGKIINIPKKKVIYGDKIIVFLKNKNLPYISENIPLQIIYEDKYILIINKPAGLVVHPGNKNDRNTLLNALLNKYHNVHFIPRAGIVHRLDKYTTGLMIIAKDVLTYFKLLNLIKNKKIIRKYEAFVFGDILSGGIINDSIKRHVKKRICMVVNSSGKSAITYYSVIQKFERYTHLSVQLYTGRTHQIRVHMLHIKHPILGDPIYKFRGKSFLNISDNSKYINRQALHASNISFIHPITSKYLNFYQPIPEDMISIIKYL